MTRNVSPGGLQSALRRAGVAEVDASNRRRAEYSSDASLYRVVPTAVAFPRTRGEVVAAMDVCRDLGVPVTARGGGTSIAGNAVGTGLIVDFSRHLNKVHRLDVERRTATVDPGVILDDLQTKAAPHRLRFGPDPSSHSRCTIGGMIANNACGSRALRYGRTGDHIAALDLLTGTGECLALGREPDPDTSPTLAALRGVIGSRLGVVRREFGRFGRQGSGYSLEHLLPERGFDAARAVAGSEGGWGLLLGATVRLVEAPALTRLVVLGYADMATAADDVVALLPFEPVALEGLDARIVDVVRRHHGGQAVPDLPRGGGWLLAELAGSTTAGLDSSVRDLVAASGALDTRVAADAAAAAALWRIREDGAGLATRVTPGRPGQSGWEDAAVPPEHLGAYLRDFEDLLTEHGLAGVPYGHFGDGCVHVRIDFPLDAEAGRSVFREFLHQAAGLVAGYGGSMSGEHGDGRARSELLPLMYSAEAIEALGAVKAVFDPDGLCNPGVVVDPGAVDADLRLAGARPVLDVALTFPHDSGDLSRAVHRCIGVGKCRVEAGAAAVMCPSFRATRDEKDSTRGRARVLQEMVNGELVSGWDAAEVHESLDLCLACKACSSDCPTGVDMASYKAEALHQRYRGRRRPAAHYSLGWLPRWARMSAYAPGLVNALLAGPLASTGARLAGLDPRRQLPVFAGETFRRWFRRHPPAAGDPVVLWVDTFTNHFTPQVGIAAVAVLEAAGYSVQVVDASVCCGLTYLSTGQLDAARTRVRASVQALTPYAAVGTPVVGLEPSCTALLRGDAAQLLGDTAEGAAVAGGMYTLAELLTGRSGWAPPRLDGTEVVAQPHCHQHAVMGWSADERLLAGAGAEVAAVQGCCGMAGNFGAERGHYDVSVAVAETALLPAIRRGGSDAVLLTDGFSCRLQVRELAHRESVHLAELLAAAGGGDR